jgi:long-chain acyl-CoA synthetase
VNVAEEILARGRPEATAIDYGDQVVRYAELRRSVCDWALRLLAEELQPGDRVGLFAENSPLWAAAYLGIIRAGLCAVPLPVDTAAATFHRLAVATGMRRAIVSPRFADLVRPWAEAINLELLAEVPPQQTSADLPSGLPEIDPYRDLAAIMLTSGSTGEAKGVMVTHRNIQCNTCDIIEYLGLSADDRCMTVLPFYYCYGTSLLHTHLMAGASLVLNNRFMFPEKVLDELQGRQCSGFAGVPSTYQILLRKTHFARRRFPSLRWLQQAGGKLPNPLIEQLRQTLPEVRLYVMYGQTEATARLSYLPPERLGDKLGSIGKGLSHSRLEVLKADGTPVRPGSDELGEIVASGDSITAGYWKDGEETRRYFRGGKLYTGDMARVDSDGFIFIAERARDFIKAMGNRVSPKEVEEVIAELPQVVEAAVIGVPHELWGEALKAFVVTAVPGQLTSQQVRAHCLRRLPNHKIPEFVEFWPTLPKTSNGKVAKERLRAESGEMKVVR